VKIIITVFLICCGLFADERCQEKRERLDTLQAQKSADDAATLFAWITLTQPTSDDDGSLSQQIRILQLELSACPKDRPEAAGQ